MKIPSKVFFINVLDSQPTPQRPNLSWQPEVVPAKVRLKHTPQKEI